jgi:hypothetical protein
MKTVLLLILGAHFQLRKLLASGKRRMLRHRRHVSQSYALKTIRTRLEFNSHIALVRGNWARCLRERAGDAFGSTTTIPGCHLFTW